MQIIVNLLMNGFAVFVSAYVLKGVHVSSFFTAIIVAVVLGIINILIKPVISILTLPFTILTFGIFAVILNGVWILVASAIVPGFKVDGIAWAILFSIVLSVVNWFLRFLTK